MTPPWLVTDPAVELEAPLTNGPGERSPEALLAVVRQFEVETAPRYARRRIEGYGTVTWCNRYVADVTKALGCPVPYQRANEMVGWLERTAGQRAGWREVQSAIAGLLTQRGMVTVLAWRNPVAEEPGHVAIMVPIPRGKPQGYYVAQAGKTNGVAMSVGAAFGRHPPRYFTHE